MRGPLLRLLISVLAAVAVLGSVIGLGELARRSLGAPDGSVRWDQIEVELPSTLSATSFLTEVRERAALPDPLPETGLAQALSKAFRASPWVETVERIAVRRGGPVQVVLTFRIPVLGIPVGKTATAVPDSLELTTPGWRLGSTEKLACRVVDRKGVFVPRPEGVDRLPVLLGPRTEPAGHPGERWGDGRVETAAAVVSVLQPHLARLGLVDCFVRVEGPTVVLEKPFIRILWGRPPGSEGAEEAPVAVKVRRLLDYHEREGDLGPRQALKGGWGLEHNLAPAAAPSHRPLRGP